MPTDAPAAPGAPPPRPPPVSRRTLRLAALAAVVVAVLVVVAGVLKRSHQSSETRTWTAQASVPAVGVIHPSAQAGAQDLTLPGQLQAYYNAPIYSRVSGYVHGWYQDIGAKVKAGQLLATIDTPELDQQIVQARADLETAKANMALAATTSARWAKLLKQDAVSQQEAEEKAGDLAAKTAQVDAARANVSRLMALKGFARIVAPFDGVVTARKTDIGALVNAGAGATANSELFDVSKIDPLRLYVRVPQADSAAIGPGTTATLTVPEYPGRSFAAKLATTANAVSESSGTVLTELMVDNPGATLKAGDYADVKFDTPDRTASSGALRVPSSALLFRNRGMEAAVVGPDDRVQIRHVAVGRNLGSTIEVTSGLAASDRVVDNPPDSIANGELVRVIQPGAAAKVGG